MLTRRSLIVGGLRASALVSAWPLLQAANSAVLQGKTKNPRRVLVVLQLTGGNDGLNTVIPWDHDSYWRLRPTLGQAKNKMHRLDDHFALHPSLGGLHELYIEGQVAVVQGVGLPRPNRSHFRSMDVWHTGTLDTPLPAVGWLGRLADQLAAQNATTLPALALGAGELPYSLRALETQASAVESLDSLRLRPMDKAWQERRTAILETPRSGDLQFLANAARMSYATANRLEALQTKNSKSDYPQTRLAQGFAAVAQMVAAGLGCRLFHLELGGFDTHARQAPIHADRLAKVGGALRAFQRDLKGRGLETEVRTLVFSEFGRRAQENGSKGTDHGHGAPCFVIGGGVAGGLHGSGPNLEELVEGDVPVTTDFRSVYGHLVEDWMGVRSPWQEPKLDLG